MKDASRLLSKYVPRLAALVVAGYWLFMFGATHVHLPPHIGSNGTDKYLHFGAYGLLAFLLSSAWSLWRPIGPFVYAKITTILAVYAAFDELTQIIVHRDCEYYDWVADILGTMSGCTSFILLSAFFVSMLRANQRPALAASDETA